LEDFFIVAPDPDDLICVNVVDMDPIVEKYAANDTLHHDIGLLVVAL
jgi:hypothetical protein